MTGNSCSVGDLPETRAWAPMCHNIFCGGSSFLGSTSTSTSTRSCDMFDGISTFKRSNVTLVEKREDHLCWGLKSGEVILLGGSHSTRTTERVSADAGGLSSSADFSLQYDIRYGNLNHNKNYYHQLYLAIPVE